MTARVLGTMFIGLTMASGCQDNAAIPWQSCQTSELKADWDTAVRTCENAATDDPTSKSGLAAAARLPVLRAKLEDVRRAREQAEEARQVAQAAEDAKCTTWTTICTLGRFPDGSERTTGIQSFPTKAKCEGISVARGIPCDPCKCRD